MLELIKNKRGEAVMGVFLILFFLLFVGGKVAEDYKGDKVVPTIVNTTQGGAD